MAKAPKTPFQKALARALIPVDAELLTVEDTARITRRGIMRVYEDVRFGRLPVVRFGRAIRIKKADLERFIEAQAVKA
jgi:excisionase family DNA binding protein